MLAGDSRAFALAKVIVVAVLFLSLWFYWLPAWLGLIRPNFDYSGLRALRLLGLVPLIPGAIVGTHCIFNFAWVGRGTPAPIDPPRHLVVGGYYRYVRNPMYVGFGAAIVGAWMLFGKARWAALIAMALLAIAIHLFVVLYEEPTLRRKFGADYEEFCRNVPRWWPRLKPWNREQAKGSIAVVGSAGATGGSGVGGSTGPGGSTGL
ncbi:MAG: methyltransferase family protein [Terriglobales bacterium]